MFSFRKRRQDTAAAAYDCGDYPLALKLAQKELKKNPGDTDSLLIIGNVFYLRKDYSQADFWYQKILSLRPESPEALINHGEVLLRQKDYEGAGRVADTLSRVPAGILLRAKIDFEQEKYSAAERGFLSFLEQNNNDFWGWNLLSQAAQKNARWDLALEAAWQAVEKSGGADSQHLNLAYALYEITLETGVETVLPVLRKWCEKYAGNGIVEHTRNAFFPDKNFHKSDLDYVRNVFDNFADSFEQILSELDYRVPELIAAEISRIFPQNLRRRINVLDAGCGTGLCALRLDSRLRKYRFFGVDLSAEMLAVAAAKKLYSDLENDELENYLRRHRNKFDLIVAADVLTYFGTLENLFGECFESLVSGGVLVFSVTRNNLNGRQWFQHLSGRFVHQEKYVRHALEQSGFSDMFFTPCTLRREAGKEVRGWIVSAWKK